MAQDILLVNLAFALVAGFIGAAIATRLGQSAIVGYILGGILIGPHTPGFVGNPEIVEALANIGIILLMFAVGVQISIDDLLRAGRIAILGGLLQVIVTIALGYAIGVALGWSPLEAFVFGSVVSNSSSTVLSKVLGDRGEMDTTHGRIGLAWSTVQDLSTVALVVIFSALAIEGNDLWTELVVAIGKAGLFLVILLPVGWKLLPWFFERVVGPQNREVFIVAVAAFALGTAYVSSFFGLSLALGAFVAGIVVSESDIWHQILDDIIPLRDLFIVLFFVSVGMLVDPAFIVRNIPLVLLGVASISVLKGMIVAAIMLLFRYPLGSSILTGIVLAQSAEFSLLLAREGAELGIVGSTLFNLMVSSVVLSIFLAPLLHLAGQPLIARIQQLLPASELSRLPALENPDSHLRGHAVIIGYGRVGGVIGDALRRRGFPFLVIDHDQGVVRRLRAQGIPALLGSGDNRTLLDQARLRQARVLVIAIPDALSTRHIVDYALQVNPDLHIVARTHTRRERAFLVERGVSEAVIGELELALEMARFTLHRFGVSTIETQAFLQKLRTQQDSTSQL
ncbi:cation:proton antiporter [Thermomicrobiaceae bacterium CFH 74404]|uniref:Cation:proton antiporter n=1 Tax=Thermalbibacter longus TaxID=2951981 RepID=A0AA42BAE5_9BACT|nr:cation:proton antiporter [Thermalbibacter longus]MCM8748410.1 cation:proton antiporter [Thermalbibacter longus]